MNKRIDLIKKIRCNQSITLNILQQKTWTDFATSIADGRRKPEDEDMRVAAHAIAREPLRYPLIFMKISYVFSDER